MVPVLGTGTYITMAVVQQNGEPIDESSVENQGWVVKETVRDERVLQWMLSLHQIGISSYNETTTSFTTLFYSNGCFALQALTLLEQIGIFPFMRMVLISPNYGMFLPYILG